VSEYTEQAEKFLADTQTTLTVEYLRTAPYFHSDKESRDIYRFTLKNERGEYSSEFGNSIRATEDRANACKYRAGSTWRPSAKDEAALKASIARHKEHPKPNAYDILSCIEKSEPEPIFEDWARELGFDDAPMVDYPKIRAIHDACLTQYAGICRLFTPEQMEQLQEIS